jgi:hypothetical protein
MADRKFSDYAGSGEAPDIFVGGVTPEDKLAEKGELTAANVSQDNSGNELLATTVQGSIEELANVGLTQMITSTPLTAQTLTTSDSKLTAFSEIKTTVNGAVTGDLVNQRFTINKTGLYKVYGMLNAEFQNASYVGLKLYKNGLEISPAVELQGRGAGKPVVFPYTDLVSLAQGDFLEIWAYSDATLDFTVIGASMIVEKTIF